MPPVVFESLGALRPLTQTILTFQVSSLKTAAGGWGWEVPCMELHMTGLYLHSPQD